MAEPESEVLMKLSKISNSHLNVFWLKKNNNKGENACNMQLLNFGVVREITRGHSHAIWYQLPTRVSYLSSICVLLFNF